MKIVTAAEMREIDRSAIEDLGIAGVVLMENAGMAVVQAAYELLEASGGSKVGIFAGKGNNGGDGFVVARHLHNAGYDVQVYLLAQADQLRGDAAVNCGIAQRMDVPIHEVLKWTAGRIRRAAAGADLLVDAIFGTGLSGEVRGPARHAIEALNASGAPILAVDMPSGVHADTGAKLGSAVQATVTVTFGLLKAGLYQYPGAELAGRVRIADIGIPPAVVDAQGLKTELITGDLVRPLLPERPPAGHKGDFGRVLVVAGSRGMTGACALAAEGALRVGAGLVTMAVPESLNSILEAKVTEATSVALPETEVLSLSIEAEDDLARLSEGADAVVLGPGLSQAASTQELVRALVPRIGRPLVLDADGLNALAGAKGVLRRRRQATIITPHPGELARLRRCSIGEIQADRLASARGAAADLGCNVLLKGAGTVVAAPDGRAAVNPTGNSGLACGGTGDVLAGMVGGLVAGGLQPYEAGLVAAFWHGLAADVAVEKLGERSLVASDVCRHLGAAALKIQRNQEPN